MRLFIVLTIVTLLISGCSKPRPEFSKIDDPTWELVWQDEFNTDGSPDQNKWNYDTGSHGWGNHELQNFTKEKDNVYVSEGSLKLTALYHPGDVLDGYSSGRINTLGKCDITTGRVEIRAKMAKGRGIWNALWMVASTKEYGQWPNSGEIDITEMVGFLPHISHATIHVGDYNHMNGNHKQASLQLKNTHKEFHTYAVEIFDDYLDIFVDDIKYFTYKKEKDNYHNWPFDKPFHIVMSLSVGGSWGGQEGVDNKIFPQSLEVDYVRVYKHKE